MAAAAAGGERQSLAAPCWADGSSRLLRQRTGVVGQGDPVGWAAATENWRVILSACPGRSLPTGRDFKAPLLVALTLGRRS